MPAAKPKNIRGNPCPSVAKFSRIVKRWRTARDLSKADAARKLGVPYRTLQDWELGNRTPTGIRRRLLEAMFTDRSTLSAKQ